MGKKYCIFTAVYFPHLGGLEWYTYNLAKQLIRKGDEVVVVASRLKGLKEYEEIGGVPIYRVPCFELLNGRYPIIKPGKQLKVIEKIMKEKQFDRFIINTRFYVHSIWAANYAKKQRIPFIVLEHGTSHLSVHNVVMDKIGAIYEHFHTMILKTICKNFYGTCEACNEWLEHFHIKSKGVIYNAIDLEEVQKGLELPPLYRKKYAIPENALMIVFTGRMLEEKGVIPLVQAFKKINEKYSQVYLLLAGEGPLDSYVEKEKNEHIIPLGRISHEEVFRLLGEADIFCLPSFSEAFCGAVLEAVACKCYVITTKRGGAKELISEKKYGTIIENNDEKTVYQALEDVVLHWDERKKAVEKVYHVLVENFTWDKIAEQVQKIEF